MWYISIWIRVVHFVLVLASIIKIESIQMTLISQVLPLLPITDVIKKKLKKSQTIKSKIIKSNEILHNFRASLW